jgi:UDP-glucose:(heptosyl)LPS alpha-1,3-glucosyltransferase
VVPNGFDPARFNRGLRETQREAVRHEIGAVPGELVLLFAANELHRKGFEQTLRAVALSSDERFSVHVVGRADPAPFGQLAAELGLEGRLQYHGSSDRVERYMAAADLLVLPTQYEPFGLVIVEALACGLPVITTTLAGAAQAVQPGVNGVLLEDPWDVEQLADLLRTAGAADLERWSAAAAASVDEYRLNRVMDLAARCVRPA